jgi:diguanylate cyclase
MGISTQQPAPVSSPVASVAQRAKNALRRLALDKLEPTPENYAVAYRMESGAGRPPVVPPEALAIVQRLAQRAFGDEDEVRIANVCKAFGDGQWESAETLFGDQGQDGMALATLVDRLVRGMERGNRQWTLARKKDGIQRVLDGSRADARRLQQRLSQLVASWDSDTPGDSVELDPSAAPAGAANRPPSASGPGSGPGPGPGPEAEASPAGLPELQAPQPAQATAWGRAIQQLASTVTQALSTGEPSGQEAAREIEDVVRRILEAGAAPAQEVELAAQCENARRLLQHRHQLIEQLGALCRELTASLTELAEDDSWAKGQCDAMRIMLEDGITSRGVKSVNELLRVTRERQAHMRDERRRARDALKTLIARMLGDVGDLGTQTGKFHTSVGRYADVIEHAESIDALTDVVRQMLEESHAVQSSVAQTQQRLTVEHSKASDLTERVNMLEGELRRLSGEVSTDQLTQVANRRGLLRDFEAECERMRRDGGTLAMGLLDIDNFKRLNDELGHNAGDEALKLLAQAVKASLREQDSVARYGGEEFVVLLPDTSVDDAQDILTRLQRNLSSGLFMHEQRSVMVTFSAGVTLHRSGERIEDSLERADQALFEAKRNGKNRTCAA